MNSPRPLVGWIGLDAPVEVLAAIGSPFRVDTDPAGLAAKAAPFGEGGGHPWMRAVTARILALAPTLDRVVIGATPVNGVWLYNFFLTLERGPGAPALPPIELVNLAHDCRPSAAAMNLRSLVSLVDRLGAGPDALRDAITERNTVRGLQRRIEALRYGPAARLTGSAARRLLDAADRIEGSAYIVKAQAAWAEPLSRPALDINPVIYSGPGSPSLDLYLALEHHGLSVVGDDADFGTRAIGPDVDVALPPAEGLARRYADRFPAPAGWTTAQRVEWLTGLARERGAEAVVFDIPAWSHPAAWDFPAERRALEALGIACIVAPPTAPAEAALAVADVFKSLKGGRRIHV
jgi:hypothetical protein